MTLVERFLKYVSFDTQSNEESGVTPSTPGQMVFAKFLKEELETLGLEEITLDENGYLFATLPANIDKAVPVVGFIAHMDTSPDMSGKDVSPRIVENYDGKDIVLCADEKVVLSTARFPELLDHKGEDLIVTNGKTLLGADDKAGIDHVVVRHEESCQQFAQFIVVLCHHHGEKLLFGLRLLERRLFLYFRIVCLDGYK